LHATRKETEDATAFGTGELVNWHASTIKRAADGVKLSGEFQRVVAEYEGDFGNAVRRGSGSTPLKKPLRRVLAPAYSASQYAPFRRLAKPYLARKKAHTQISISTTEHLRRNYDEVE
jgi:hypothetical protein